MKKLYQKTFEQALAQTYAPPERVREYLATDPCTGCLCPRDLCSTPCRSKQTWEKEKEAAK